MQLGDLYERKYAYMTLLSLISLISNDEDDTSYRRAGPTCDLCTWSTSFLMLALSSVTYSPTSSFTGQMVPDGSLTSSAIELLSCCQTLPPLSPKSYSKMPQVSPGDRRGTLYPQGLCFYLFHTLNFWTRFVCKDSSEITEKRMKSQDREAQLTRLGWQLRKSGPGCPLVMQGKGQII